MGAEVASALEPHLVHVLAVNVPTPQPTFCCGDAAGIAAVGIMTGASDMFSVL